MSRCVTVSGPPAAIWRRKIGTTEPDEPSTLPKRTAQNAVPGKRWSAASTAHSASALEAPITVAGETALSVETSTKAFGAGLARDLAHHAASRARCCAPPRPGSPPSGARACRRRRGRRSRAGARANTSRIRSPSLQSASTATVLSTWRSSTSSRRICEQVVLGVVEQDELARADARDLAAQLGADRAAGARDEHDAAGQVAADAVEVHPHGLAAEDVLHLDLADLAQQAPAGPQQLEDRRHRAHRHAALAARGRRRGRASCPAPRGSRSAPRRARRRRAPRRSSAVVPSTESPRSIRAPCLRGSSSMKPTGR